MDCNGIFYFLCILDPLCNKMEQFLIIKTIKILENQLFECRNRKLIFSTGKNPCKPNSTYQKVVTEEKNHVCGKDSYLERNSDATMYEFY